MGKICKFDLLALDAKILILNVENVYLVIKNYAYSWYF